MLRKKSTLTVHNGRPATAFFNRMLENFERKFDGFPARVNPALVSPASQGVDFVTELTDLTVNPDLPPGGVPICPDTGGDCIPPRDEIRDGGLWLGGSPSTISVHNANNQRNRDGDIYSNVHIESGQNIWRWYYDDTIIQDYDTATGSGGRCTYEWYHTDAYRYFFSGNAIQTEFGSKELAVNQYYRYVNKGATPLPDNARYWILEFDWEVNVSGTQYDRAAASDPGGFVHLTGPEAPPPQHVKLSTLIPHHEHYAVGEVGRVYAERMVTPGIPQSGHAMVTVPRENDQDPPPLSPESGQSALHFTVSFGDYILTKPNGTVTAVVTVGGLVWRPNVEGDGDSEGDVASDCYTRWSFDNVLFGDGWGDDWYTSGSTGGTSVYTTEDGRAHAAGAGVVSQSVNTEYPDDKDYITQWVFYINGDVSSVGVSRGTSEQQFQWTSSEIVYLRGDSIPLQQYNATGMMNTDYTMNLLEFRSVNGIRSIFLNGHSFVMPASDGRSGDFTIHVGLVSGGHFELDSMTIMCKNASNAADPECSGTTKTEDLGWSEDLQAYVPSLIPSYYVSVQIDGLSAVEGVDYTVCGTSICGIEPDHEVTAQYVIA